MKGTVELSIKEYQNLIGKEELVNLLKVENEQLKHTLELTELYLEELRSHILDMHFKWHKVGYDTLEEMQVYNNHSSEYGDYYGLRYPHRLEQLGIRPDMQKKAIAQRVEKALNDAAVANLGKDMVGCMEASQK